MEIKTFFTKDSEGKYDGGILTSISLPEEKRRVYFKDFQEMERGPFEKFTIETKRREDYIDQKVFGTFVNGLSSTLWRGGTHGSKIEDSLRIHIQEFGKIEELLKGLFNGMLSKEILKNLNGIKFGGMYSQRRIEALSEGDIFNYFYLKN